MSLTQKLWLGTVMGLLLGGAGAALRPPSSVQPEILTSQKMRWLPASERQMQGKAHQSLQVKIRNLNDLPTSPDEPLQLEISLSSSRPLDQAAQYRWTLPESVRLVEGEAGVREIELSPGETLTLNATVVGMSSQTPQVLRFDLIGRSQGEPLAAQGFFASHPTQIDLSRRPLLPHRDSSGFEKASAEEESFRLPAGIHF